MSERSCLVCALPAQVHHARHENMAMGKGMGGSPAWDEHDHLIDLCPEHHRNVHDKVLTLSPPDEVGVIQWDFSDGRKGLRATEQYNVPVALPDRLVYVTDNALVEAWAEGDALGVRGYVMQCLAAYGFRQRYGWADGWYRRVADMIRDQTGLSVSVGAVYDRCAVGTYLASLPEGSDFEQELGQLGRYVAKTLGQLPEGEREPAREKAHELRGAGERMVEVARAIAPVQTSEKSPACEETGIHVCKFCREEIE